MRDFLRFVIRLFVALSLVVLAAQFSLGRADAANIQLHIGTNHEASANSVPAAFRGWFRLKTLFQGPDKCLEGSSGHHGAFMDDCQSVTGQLWKLVPDANGYYRLQTKFQGRGMCLEGNRADNPAKQGAFMDRCQSVTGQLWKPEEVTR